MRNAATAMRKTAATSNAATQHTTSHLHSRSRSPITTLDHATMAATLPEIAKLLNDMLNDKLGLKDGETLNAKETEVKVGEMHAQLAALVSDVPGAALRTLKVPVVCLGTPSQNAAMSNGESVSRCHCCALFTPLRNVAAFVIGWFGFRRDARRVLVGRVRHVGLLRQHTHTSMDGGGELITKTLSLRCPGRISRSFSKTNPKLEPNQPTRIGGLTLTGTVCGTGMCSIFC
jgi:hypothetical protein